MRVKCLLSIFKLEKINFKIFLVCFCELYNWFMKLEWNSYVLIIVFYGNVYVEEGGSGRNKDFYF